jgi:hypothetical protein
MCFTPLVTKTASNTECQYHFYQIVTLPSIVDSSIMSVSDMQVGPLTVSLLYMLFSQQSSGNRSPGGVYPRSMT